MRQRVMSFPLPSASVLGEWFRQELHLLCRFSSATRNDSHGKASFFFANDEACPLSTPLNQVARLSEPSRRNLQARFRQPCRSSAFLGFAPTLSVPKSAADAVHQFKPFPGGVLVEQRFLAGLG
jgi:hypothetical protein